MTANKLATTKPAITTPKITTKINRQRAVIGLFATALALSACGGTDITAAAPAQTSPPAPVASPAPATDVASNGFTAASAGASSLGDILVGSNGLTVYGFANDVNATSACYGTCADAWPPVIVDASWDVAPGLDSGIFNAVIRDDGTLQLVAGKWPLYFFAGDNIPGDVNGQGSGDVWFAVDTDGILITDSPASTQEQSTELDEVAARPAIAIAETAAGTSLVDVNGLTLYGFLNDELGVPSCEGACADAWPPFLLSSADLPLDLDPAVFSTVERSDGSFQLKAGKWPLYRFAGDATAGDINGQGSGDSWFVAAPDGGLLKGNAGTESAAPAKPAAPARPAAPASETDDEAADQEDEVQEATGGYDY